VANEKILSYLLKIPSRLRYVSQPHRNCHDVEYVHHPDLSCYPLAETEATEVVRERSWIGTLPIHCRLCSRRQIELRKPPSFNSSGRTLAYITYSAHVVIVLSVTLISHRVQYHAPGIGKGPLLPK
jgi:hypothetical protein